MKSRDLVIFWQRALSEPFGIKIRSPDVARLDNLLRSARARAKDPDLMVLSIYRDPDEPLKVLWIMKNPKHIARKVA